MTRSVHDLGGLPAGPVDQNEHERTFFDQRVDAMRRAIESLPREEYFGLGYYERWVRAIRQLALEKGLISEDQLKRRLDALAAPGGQT